MNPLLVAPLLLTVGGLAAGWFVPRVVSPATCARVLTAAVVSAAAGLAAALVLLAMAGASELHQVSDVLGWCRALSPGDHGAAPWVGAAAGGVLLVAAARARRYRRRVREELAPFSGIDGVEVVATERPVAFAVPGRPGGVVVAATLLGALTSEERAAVLAHEQAHLRFHHHRYVHAVEMCAAAVPVLSPLARRVRFATERWADEAAAVEVGSRRTVARAIARVALLPGGAGAAPSLSFRGAGGTTARVEALLHPVAAGRVELPTALTATTVAASLAGASVQVHHLAVFVSHACS